MSRSSRVTSCPLKPPILSKACLRIIWNSPPGTSPLCRTLFLNTTTVLTIDVTILSDRVSPSGKTRSNAVRATRLPMRSKNRQGRAVKNESGSRITQSASRNTRNSPRAVLAPSFRPCAIVCRSVPPKTTTLSAYFSATATVPSLLPPSETMISWGDGESCAFKRAQSELDDLLLVVGGNHDGYHGVTIACPVAGLPAKTSSGGASQRMSALGSRQFLLPSATWPFLFANLFPPLRRGQICRRLRYGSASRGFAPKSRHFLPIGNPSLFVLVFVGCRHLQKIL